MNILYSQQLKVIREGKTRELREENRVAVEVRWTQKLGKCVVALVVGLGYACVAIPLPVKCCHLHDKASSEDSVSVSPFFSLIFPSINFSVWLCFYLHFSISIGK